jgi:hypothetical protein
MYAHIDVKYVQKLESNIDLNEINHVFGHSGEDTTVWCTGDGRYFLCPDRNASQKLFIAIDKIWNEKNKPKNYDFDHKLILL